MRKESLEKAKFRIQRFFNKLRDNVLARNDIKSILYSSRNTWKISESTSIKRFIEFLIKEGILKLVELKFPSQKSIRYIKGRASVFEVVINLKKDVYFTHYTSMFLHELTEQIPKTIYLNLEQARNNYNKDLSQENIDYAFGRPWRVSHNMAVYENYNIYILNGMFTGKLGVIHSKGPSGEKIALTDIERTLIDIAVRPVYSGGVYEVLKAYRNAKNRVNIRKLVKYLKEINYVYPYHQVIGFYLEKAGNYNVSQVDLLKNIGMEYDFYLTHQMKNIDYSNKWRLYYPKGF